MRCFSCNTMVGHTESINEDKRMGTGEGCDRSIGLASHVLSPDASDACTVVDDIMIYSNKDHALDECGTVFMSGRRSARSTASSRG